MEEQALSFVDTLLMALAILAPMATTVLAFLVLPKIRIPPGTFGSVAALCVVGLGVGVIALLGAAGFAPVPGGLNVPTDDPRFMGSTNPQGGSTPLQLVLFAWVAASTSALLMMGTWRAARASRRAEREADEDDSGASLFHDKRWH